jgi:hypothetical protein
MTEPHRPKPNILVPTLGFLLDPNEGGLVPIHGIASAPVVGLLIPKPDGAGRIYLPPRQHYALVEQATPEALAVWHLARRHVLADGNTEVLDAIPGAQTHPDLVAFSPRATAAVLYSGARSRLQIISGLPGQPVIQADVTANSPALTNMALSDDGKIVVALSSTHQIEVLSDGKVLRTMPSIYSPLAFSFVPNSHNLLLSDSQQGQLLLIPEAEIASSSPTFLGNRLQPDCLGATSDGATLLALDTKRRELWEIDAKTLSITPIPLSVPPESLLPLRDGHTFLLSSAPLSLLKVPDAVSTPLVLVHPLAVPGIRRER